MLVWIDNDGCIECSPAKNYLLNAHKEVCVVKKLFASRKKSIFVLFGVIFILTSSVFSQTELSGTPDRPNYTTKGTQENIKIDGILDEPSWTQIEPIKVMYEWLPGDNIPAPVDTDFLVTFNEDYLYMAYRCYDPDPSQIRAHLMDRDAMETLIQDDHVWVIIDFFNDERRGFQFRVNPLGVQADANCIEMGRYYEDFSWDAIWNAAARITEWGWTVEIAVPFNQVRFPQTTDVQTWGFSVGRSYPRSVRHRMTSHKRKRDIMCIFCQENKISGFQGMKTGLNLEIDPTLTANRTDKRLDFPAGEIDKGKINADPGLSLRWGITPNLILNAAVNPDFSQIEADVQELDINRRFAVQYPEKRPFFLEGADFFLTPFEAVFTRTVADPAGGFKFTGKMGRNAFGAFGTYDSINNLLFPSNQGSKSTSLDQDVTGGVFRFRRDIGEGSAMGILYTGRVADDYFNHVGGVDGAFRLSRSKILTLQYLRSRSNYSDPVSSGFAQEPDAFGGGALDFSFAHMGRDWMYSASYRDISPGFRADFGYIPRVDLRRANLSLSRSFWGRRGSWYNLLVVGMAGMRTYDYHGNLTDQNLSVNLRYQGPLQTAVMFMYSRGREFFAAKSFDQNQYVGFVEMKPFGGLRFSLTGVLGDSIDYSNLRKAAQVMLNPFVEFNLGKHFNVNLRHTFQRLRFEGDNVFTANLSQLKVIYNFNVRTFVRAIVQYMDLTRDPELYLFPVLAKTNTIFTQFLFSYKLNPQTVLFVGYSDNYLGYTGLDITQSNRTFFVKIGYAWLK